MGETGPSNKHAAPAQTSPSERPSSENLSEDGVTQISPESSDAAYHPFELAKMLRGEMLDHFELEDYVGVGGMGIVFRARDSMLNRIVALKVLPRDQASDPETERRFRKEAQSAARLDHENIARVFYMGEARGLPYIVFEYIDGQNVRDLVAENDRMPLHEAVSCVLQIAGALAHANSRNVVHRDVKPSNILLTPEGKAKLVDMGLARLREVELANSDLTASGVTLGTFDYISPEQARDPRNVDIRSDIYSLGCTFYYMVTGRPPYPEGTVLQKLLQHQGEAAPDPREFDANLHPDAVRIMQKMMAKDPADRYQSPESLISELMILAGELGLQPAGPSGMVWVSPDALRPAFWERNLPWLAPVAALAIAVAALEFFPASVPSFPLPPAETVQTPPPPLPQPDTNGSSAVQKQEPDQIDQGGNSSQGSELGPVDVAGEEKTEPENSSTVAATGGKGQVNPSPGSGENSATASTVADKETVFFIKHSPEEETRYSSLAAACDSAQPGESIELRFNGRRTTKPIELDNHNITIRAGEGFQPVLVFQPDVVAGITPNTHMFTLFGGRLMLEKVALNLTVPEEDEIAASSWSLFRTKGSPTIELSECALTIRNPSQHLGITFFDIDAVRGTEVAEVMRDPGTPAPAPVDIRLIRAVARGEATFVRCDQKDQPFSVDWNEGLLILAGSGTGELGQLVHWRGGNMAPHADSRIRLNLNRLTAHIPGGLCRLGYSTDSTYLTPKLEVTSTRCVFAGQAESPLIEMASVANYSESRDRLNWSGDMVYYEKFKEFWRIAPSMEQPSTLVAKEWKDYWGSSERDVQLNSIPWKQPLPASDVAASERNLSQYELAPPENGEVGAPIAVLPHFPMEN